jgi:hypothetical protein
MEMTRKEIKEKMLKIKEVLGWTKVGKYKGTDLYLNDISEQAVAHWGYVKDEASGRNVMKQQKTTWDKLTDAEMEAFEAFIKLRFPKEYEVKRESYLISFKNPEINETLAVNLKDKKFTKTYKSGSQRDVKYPHSFFKGMDGRIVSTKIPSDDNFKKLVDTIIKKESSCSNFGTFLVRLFDNIHLETYISAKVPFDYNIRVGYDFFDKDVRAVLNKHEMKYDKVVEQFFANNHDLGKSMLHYIKDEKDFEGVFKSLAQNMRDVNILVENYKYDVGTLFKYCQDRKWQSGRNNWGNNRDLVSYMCDYARMAELVWPNGFDKYPPNIVEWHDGASKLYAKEKIKYNEVQYQKLIDDKLEYEQKGKEDEGFCIVYPKTTTEIQDEGRLLGHCVGSYVQYVLNKSSIIVFMRTKAERNTPLVTIEIKPADKRISQSRGKFNRALTYDEKVFLEEYAEKKGLRYTAGNY